MFNETTHRMSQTQVKPDGLWIFWRATLAEQFSASITDFFNALSLDNTGTYLNGYMLVDANTNETGLVEMSYRCFVYYRSNGGPYTVSSSSLDGNACSTDYDGEMITSTKMVRSFMGLSGILEPSASNTGFWMLYGTPYVNGKPVIWSQSVWNSQTLRDVPDRLAGLFTLMPLYLR